MVVIGPAELLERAWAAEPGLRLAERTSALDELAALLDAGPVPDPPPDRDWGTELLAERAVDAARLMQVSTALALADRVLTAADSSEIARARATEARGRALAFRGTDAAVRRAEMVLLDAVDRYANLGRTEWQGYALFCLGNAVHLLSGELAQAIRYLEQALSVLAPDSPRRGMVLDFCADLLVLWGQWRRAEEVLAEAEELAHARGDATVSSYAAWTRARMSSARGDALATQRYLREAERESADWMATLTGTTFLAEAAELLDRVGRHDEAGRYLRRAFDRDPADPFVRQAGAVLQARSGDPEAGLEALEALAGEQLLEKGLRWRHTLLAAWATLRLGGPEAGAITARGLAQAEESGGLQVAVAGEPDLVTALLPAAEAAGSDPARRLLLGESRLLVRLLGPTRLTWADGARVALPGGQAAELVQLLALHPFGLPVPVVLEQFFPEVAEATARHRLRQLLTTLRATAGELVLRNGERIELVPAWVDARAFQAAADRARAARGARAIGLAHAAVALWDGPSVPRDRYSEWIDPVLDRLRFRYLDLLDQIVADALRRGSRREARNALLAAMERDPHDTHRRILLTGL